MDIASSINGVFEALNGVLWGLPMILILMGTHVFMTVRTGFIQRKLLTGIKLSIKRDPSVQGDISPFAALATALAPTIGTGNIVGVGTAIALGGPGAVFWMWLTGIFGIATKYAESYVGVKYRVKTESGNMLGGAMYALERGLKQKWLAILFCVFAALASFGIGSMVQANAVATVVEENVGIPAWIIGIALVILTALATFGGIKVIARVCERLVPFMAIIYVAGCLVILGINWNFILPALGTIVQAAFMPQSAFGGFVGSTIAAAARFGVARGIFSNESGLGSAPLAAAAARSTNPARQALISMTGTFWDTVIICALTGLVLVSTILAHPELAGEFTGGNGAILTTTAFAQIPFIGVPLLVFGMITFAYTTILGWSYYGDRCIDYLFGKKALIPYRVIYCVTIFLGTLGTISLVWNMADTFNALMALPNLIAVLGLSALIARETKHFVYEDNLDEAADQDLPVAAGK
ncbi:MAG: sodium:alanine symporter family protein [Coriobacteriales bacterium]|nr:sodium:alanine symporter family protein [Coriobacteriales bacterium]